MKKQNIQHVIAGVLTLACTLGIGTQVVASERPALSAGVNVGSLGAGATLALEINSRFEARLGFNQFSANFDLDVEELNYQGDIELQTTTAIVDFYPWQNRGFRLSAGLFANGNEITGTAEPANSTTFGGRVFQPEDIGSASATISFPSSAPYLGLGWGKRTSKDNRLLFSVDAGVFMQGGPEADISVENPNNVITDEDIRLAREELQEQLDDFDIYPVLTIGLSYSF